MQKVTTGQPSRLQSPTLYAPLLNKGSIVFATCGVLTLCRLLSALVILYHFHPPQNHMDWALLTSHFRKGDTEDREGNEAGSPELVSSSPEL